MSAAARSRPRPAWRGAAEGAVLAVLFHAAWFAFVHPAPPAPPPARPRAPRLRWARLPLSAGTGYADAPEAGRGPALFGSAGEPGGLAGGIEPPVPEPPFPVSAPVLTGGDGPAVTLPPPAPGDPAAPLARPVAPPAPTRYGQVTGAGRWAQRPAAWADGALEGAPFPLPADACGDQAWSAELDLRFDDAGTAVGALVVASDTTPERNDALVRALLRWRLADPRAPREGRVRLLYEPAPVTLPVPGETP